MVPPTTLVCALIAKRPKPPPGSGRWPAQISVSRSEAASAASVPSILSVGLTLIEPSNAVFSGEPATRSFRPLRSPASAAGEIGERDARVHRFVMPGEAAGGAEALGDRRPGQRKIHAVQRLDGLAGLAQHHGAAVDAYLGERRDAGRAGDLAAPAPRSGPTSWSGRSAPDRSRCAGAPAPRRRFDAADQQRESAGARSAARR